MPITLMQQTIQTMERILTEYYDLSSTPFVTDFIVNEASSETTERACLIIKQKSEEELELGLYFSSNFQEAFQAAFHDPQELMPLRTLTFTQLDLLAVLAEELSHFEFFWQRAHAQHSTSLLELEYQAEIDKFIVLASLLLPTQPTLSRAALVHCLYEQVHFFPNNAEIRDRYELANRLAHRFWSQSNINQIAEIQHPEIQRRLRKLYQAPLETKISI